MPRPGSGALRRSLMVRYGMSMTILAALWGLMAGIVVPYVITVVHAGRGLRFLGRLMAGREHTALESYMTSWEVFARSVTGWLGGMALAIGLVVWLWQAYRPSRGARSPSAKQAHSASSIDGFLLLVWFGVLTGLGESYFLGAKLVLWRELVPGFLHVSHMSLWMAPLAAAAVGVLIGLAYWAIQVRWPGGLRSAAFLGSSLMGLTWIMMTGRLHWIAGITIAVGAALHLSRVMARHPAVTVNLVRRSLPALGGIVLLLGAAERGRATWTEQRVVAALPPAKAELPNVILIVLDTQRAASMSLYGFARPTTPFLEQLAARAVVFDWAIAPENWTLPSHATMFTSRFNTTLHTGWRSPMGDTYPTVAEVLSDNGYLTAGFVANLNYLGDEFFGLARGFAHWSDQELSPATVVASSWLTRTIDQGVRWAFGVHTDLLRKPAQRVNAEFMAWHRRVGSRPYFAFFNFFDVHAPYRTPEFPVLPTTSPKPRYWPKKSHRLAIGDADLYTANEIRDMRESYEAAIAYLDRQLQSLFTYLDVEGDIQNTLVVITSDHGEQFGEHGRLGHWGRSQYLPVLHVPLMIIPPSPIPSGIRIADPVSLADLPATITQLLGIRKTPFLGASLARYWADDSVPGTPRPVFSGTRDVSVVADGWHYIRTRASEATSYDREELYHMVRDPEELRDVVSEGTEPLTLGAMRSLVDSIVGSRSPKARLSPITGPWNR